MDSLRKTDLMLSKNPQSVAFPVQSRVLIVVPSYNEEEYIRECLESLKAQTYQEFIVLISDNASTDRTEEEIEEAVSTDSRFVYIRQQENLGIVGNFNFLLENTSCEFLLVMGAHDKLSPDYLQVTIAALERNSEAIIAYTDVRDIDTNSNPFGVEVIPDYAAQKRRTPLQRLFCIPEAMLINQMIRRKAVPPQLRQQISIGCDHIFLAILHYWGPIVKCPGVLYQRRYFNKERETQIVRLGGERRLRIFDIFHYARSFSRAVWSHIDEPELIRGCAAILMFLYVFTFQVLGSALKK